MILQILVQHVEEIVLHQSLNHQLIQVVLRQRDTHTHTSMKYCKKMLKDTAEMLNISQMLKNEMSEPEL